MKKIIKFFLSLYCIFICTITIIAMIVSGNVSAVPILVIMLFAPFALYRIKKRKQKKSCTEPTTVERIDAYIQTGNATRRVDGKPISDEEIPYLIQAGYENKIRREQESTNPKFHRTPHEEELSFNFFSKYHDKAFAMADKSCLLYNEAIKTKDLPKRIELLNEAVIAFQKAKNFCYSKGKGGTIYFQDMWECMSNSENPCYSYLDVINDALNKAITERDVIIPSVIDFITENDGVLQKDIYNSLPHIQKSDIQRIIRNLEAENKIVRVKKSSSYELHSTK